MSEKYDPAEWIANWPHDKISIADAWGKVHTRFGYAAQEGSKLETALVMLISQTQQILQRQATFDDLLAYLEENGSLTLGKLARIFEGFFQPSDELKEALLLSVKKRNYLVHHFYRHRASLFDSPEGCEKMQEELVLIQYDLSTAYELLENWRDQRFGVIPEEDRWNRINADVEKWRGEQDAMLKAILGKKNSA